MFPVKVRSNVLCLFSIWFVLNALFFVTSFGITKVEAAKQKGGNESDVVSLKTCKNFFKLYLEENVTIPALPLDKEGNIISNVKLNWESNNTQVASVTTWGEVEAINLGEATIKVWVGQVQEQFNIVVVEGYRIPQPDEIFDQENGGCGEQGPVTHKKIKANWGTGDLIDGSGEDGSTPLAASPLNEVGTPRLSPIQMAKGGGIKTKYNNGNANFIFSYPVLNSIGRGIGVNLSLTYNSQVWNKENNKMVLNTNKGWPALGWSIGYGRIISNYDGTAGGNKSGIGQLNPCGNYLLIQSDGTRVILFQKYDTSSGKWLHESRDGQQLKYSPTTGKLRYADGTLVTYEATKLTTNNRILPVSIKCRNGGILKITYRTYDKTNFPTRWGITYIDDTNRKGFNFKYYGDPSYPEDSMNGKPKGALAECCYVKMEYELITLRYKYDKSLTIDPSTPANGSTIAVLKRINCPKNGFGYVFDYSDYGIIKKISSRQGMNTGINTFGDGVEIARTSYNYVDTTTQIGLLSEVPKYNQRREWWSDKTDDTGNPTTAESVYTYTRSTGTGTKTSTELLPNGTQIDTVIDNNSGSIKYGKATSVVIKQGGAVLKKTMIDYAIAIDGSLQISTLQEINEKGQTKKVTYEYENYGRVKTQTEYDFAGAVVRKTRWTYLDTSSYINANMLYLTTQISIEDKNGKVKSKKKIIYDNYPSMENYGLTVGTYPWGHDDKYDGTKTLRGNVTSTTIWSDVDAGKSNTRNIKYDIFGNVVEAEVSCCNVRRYIYDANAY